MCSCVVVIGQQVNLYELKNFFLIMEAVGGIGSYRAVEHSSYDRGVLGSTPTGSWALINL